MWRILRLVSPLVLALPQLEESIILGLHVGDGLPLEVGDELEFRDLEVEQVNLLVLEIGPLLARDMVCFKLQQECELIEVETLVPEAVDDLALPLWDFEQIVVGVISAGCRGNDQHRPNHAKL